MAVSTHQWPHVLTTRTGLVVLRRQKSPKVLPWHICNEQHRNHRTECWVAHIFTFSALMRTQLGGLRVFFSQDPQSSSCQQCPLMSWALDSLWWTPTHSLSTNTPTIFMSLHISPSTPEALLARTHPKHWGCVQAFPAAWDPPQDFRARLLISTLLYCVRAHWDAVCFLTPTGSVLKSEPCLIHRGKNGSNMGSGIGAAWF